MADEKDIPKTINPWEISIFFQKQLTASERTITLEKNEINAAKHTAASAIYSDIHGPLVAEIYGNSMENIQYMLGLLSGNQNLDDHDKDYTNNFIGRELRQAFPDQSAAQYYEASVILAKSGYLITNSGYIDSAFHSSIFRKRPDHYAIAEGKANEAINYLVKIGYFSPTQSYHNLVDFDGIEVAPNNQASTPYDPGEFSIENFPQLTQIPVIDTYY